MFRKIAEWLTGHKRREDTHPLEYVNNREERKEEAAKAAEQPKSEPHFWAPGLPAIPAAIVPPAPVEPPKQDTTIQQPPVGIPVAVSNTEPWPFPTSKPEPTVEEVKPKKPRKPRMKKV